MVADIERFIQWVRMRSPQAKTWRDYRCDLELFTSVIQRDHARDVFPRDIDHFVNSQVERGFKPSTVNRRLAAVVSFYRFLLTENTVTSCPVLSKRHYLREPRRLPRPVNEQDIRRYFQAIEDVRDRAMFTLMLQCGLRIGEVSSLQVQDLYLGESPSRMIIRGKGARERTMYLSEEAERSLHAWLMMRPKARDLHIFLSYQKKQISTTSISKRVEHVCRISGVELTAHRLRHTFADQLLSAGTPITSIQKLLGHRFVETTQTYAIANDRLVQSDFYAASQKLEGWTLLWESIDPSEFVRLAMDAPRLEPLEQTYATHVVLPETILRLPDELITQLEEYRRFKANRWRPERVVANSLLYYSQHSILWSFFCGTCGVTSVSQLPLEHVQQFVKFRLDAGRSARTVNGSLSSLHSFLIFLKEDDVPVHSSLDTFQRLKEAEHLPRYITSEQVLRLKQEMEAAVMNAESRDRLFDALLLRALFYLLWQAGLRSGELERLRFSDFYISPSNEARRLFIRDSKWRQGRTVYLTDMTLHALQAYLTIRGLDPVDGYVFVRLGKPLQKHFVSQHLSSIGRRVDIHVSAHRLRHTFATQLLNVGCTVTSIQRLLGHTSLNTTMTYARAFDQTVMLDYFRAVAVLGSASGGAWSGLDLKDGRLKP